MCVYARHNEYFERMKYKTIFFLNFEKLGKKNSRDVTRDRNKLTGSPPIVWIARRGGMASLHLDITFH